MKCLKAAALAVTITTGVMTVAGSTPAAAGDYDGDFLVRLQGTVVDPDSSAAVAGMPTADAKVSTEVLPTLTLTYFFNKNIAAELFCCFAKFDAKGTAGPIDGANLGDFWVFPPILTLQYHFDPMAGFKPYVGAGVQYMAFFNEGRSPALGDARVDLDNAWGFALQAGFDMEIGRGWYLNADVKKVWLDTDVSWKLGGTTVARADVDVDPWIFSVGVGYRFNLSDVFGARSEPVALK